MNDTEASSLLTAVWMSEAPITALADWFRENLPERRCILANHKLRGVDVFLNAELFYGAGCVVRVVLYCPTHHQNVAKNFTIESLTTPEFTEWLDNATSEMSYDALKPWWVGK